jgi:small-conductance mechanosensitive channel
MDLETVYFGNSIKNYLIAVSIIAGWIIALWLVKITVIAAMKKQAAKTEKKFDDFVVAALGKCVIPALYFFGIYAGLKYLKFAPQADGIINASYIAVITFYVIKLATMLVTYSMTSYVEKKEKDESKAQNIKGLLFVINSVIWILGAVLLLDNLGYKVSTIIAGLGIGGIAVALAAQAILGDVFSYVSILFDKPFETGDFIIVGEYMGTVENIGIKTTRIRSLSGEEIIFSNTFLTNSQVKNYKRMQRRRIVFSVGVIYSTPKEKLEKLPAVIKAAVESVKGLTFDRAHFASYGASSLDFEVVYYVEAPDYNTYMDAQQAINLKIFEEFAKLGVEFAYPTTTVFLNK